MRALLPWIVLVWGAAIVVNFLATGPSGSGSYAGGQTFAAILGVVMVVAALRQLARGRA